MYELCLEPVKGLETKEDFVKKLECNYDIMIWLVPCCRDVVSNNDQFLSSVETWSPLDKIFNVIKLVDLEAFMSYVQSVIGLKIRIQNNNLNLPTNLTCEYELN